MYKDQLFPSDLLATINVSVYFKIASQINEDLLVKVMTFILIQV